MPSPELEQLVIALDAKEAKKRIEALEGMWELRDPEAIVFLNIIYTEDKNRKVRAKAGEMLANYKGMYEELQGKRSGGGSSGLRNLLVLTLLLFIGLNVALFVLSDSDGDGEDTINDPQEARSALLTQMQTDMETTEGLARELRSRAIDYSDGLESLENLCANELGIVPDPISLNDQEKTLFPDIDATVNDAIGNYRFSLAALKTAATVWNTACMDPANAVLDSRQIIELTLESIDTASAAQDNEIAQLLAEPFNTPVPTAIPTATTTPTPEPTATPAARTREAIVESITVQPQRIQADTQEILNRLASINAGANARTECEAANFWNPPGIQMNPEEQGLYTEIALFAANEDSAFAKALESLTTLKTAWADLCEDGRASAAEISVVEIQAERLLNTIPFVEDEITRTFGS